MVRPRQIAFKMSFRKQTMTSKRCPATTNSSKIKHRRQTLKYQNVLEHHACAQKLPFQSQKIPSKCPSNSSITDGTKPILVSNKMTNQIHHDQTHRFYQFRPNIEDKHYNVTPTELRILQFLTHQKLRTECKF